MLENYKKGSIKVLIDYSTFMMVFLMFYATFARFMMYYSLAVFTLLFVVLYSDMETIGEQESRMKDSIKTYPLKGFIYGVVGFSPFILAELVIFITGVPVQHDIKQKVLNLLMSPLFNFIKSGDESIAVYLLSLLIIPAITTLGYFAGYKGFIIEDRIRKIFGIKPKIKRRKLY